MFFPKENKRTSPSLPSSFRDPSGFIFLHDDEIYRQVNVVYGDNYDYLISSGLYEALVDSSLLIRHDEVDMKYRRSDSAYKVLRPEPIKFVSYPYEWCFSQLKDAALTTLEIEKTALDYGMTLKDCSAYNVQYVLGKPMFIDTLSFEKYIDGKPWIAYRQFCQHFIAPLALMSFVDIRLNQLLRVHIDGIPLDLASSLLPVRTRFNPLLLLHVHLHSWSQKRYASRPLKTDLAKKGVSRRSLLGLIDSLASCVSRLKWKPRSVWSDYYADDSYTVDALDCKQQIVAHFLDKIGPKTAWDLGSNIGVFSRIASAKSIDTICFDADPACVELNYTTAVKNGETKILPLLVDFANPSPAIGWENKERASLLQRAPAEVVLCLALIHHLAIANNLPFDRLARFLKTICSWLIIEFVPKTDRKVQGLLATRDDIFAGYTEEAFQAEFEKLFLIHECIKIEDSQRTLYLMQAR